MSRLTIRFTRRPHRPVYGPKPLADMTFPELLDSVDALADCHEFRALNA